MIKNFIIAAIVLTLSILGCTTLASKYYWDITQNRTNSLSAASKKLLDKLNDDLKITVYSPSMQILDACNDFLAPYQKYSKHIKLDLQQTVLPHNAAGNLALFTDHNLIVSYKDQQQAIDISASELTQQKISTLLQQVINASDHWLVFVTGHQEADPADSSEFGLSKFAQLMIDHGMHKAILNLAEQQLIPDNTSLLVIANPKQDFSVKEQELLRQYIANGGNILWFTEPYSQVTGLLKQVFGLKVSQGVVIDPNGAKLGSPHPAIKILTSSAAHSINADLNSAVILPWSGNLELTAQANNWQATAFLASDKASWVYNGPPANDLATLYKHMAKHKIQRGQLDIGFAFNRQHGSREQHAIVIADSSFILNKYLPLYANAKLAANILQWSQPSADLIIFIPPPPRDLSYSPSKFDRLMYKYFFPIGLPALFILLGITIRPRRIDSIS